MRKTNKLVALGIALMMGIGMLGGCGNSSASEGSAASVDASEEVAFGIPKLSDSFNFYYTTNGYESYSMAQVYDSLVKKDADGKIVGCLAKDWDLSEDGTVYTFHLEDGVKFSDGSDLKASDVVYSMNEAIQSAYTSWIYASLVADVKAIDDATVEITLTKASNAFLDYLSNCMYFAVLSENAVTSMGDEYGTSVDKIVGTGAYTVSDWKQGEYISYTANEDYFGGVPDIKNVKLKQITDSNTAVVALQTGELYAYFDDVPGVSYEDLSNLDSVNVVDYASSIYFEVIMNCENGIFSDVNVRKAVAYAVDRQSMLVVGAEGYGSVCDYPGNRNGYTAGDPEVTGGWYELDIDKAKELIEEAGVAGEAVEIKTYADDPYPALATVLQDALTSIGLNATVLQMERSAMIDEVLYNGNYDIAICRWAAGTTDMDEIVYGSLATDSIGPSGNWSWYSNAELDGYITEAAGETDNEVRKELYRKAIEIFQDEVPQIPLYYPNGSRAYNTALTIEDGLVEYNRIFDYHFAK